MQLQCLNDGAHLGVVDARELSPLLPGDHEGGEVGGVDGEEHHREQRPDRGHEPVVICTENMIYSCIHSELS